jgi:hypothetical protein
MTDTWSAASTQRRAVVQAGYLFVAKQENKRSTPSRHAFSAPSRISCIIQAELILPLPQRHVNPRLITSNHNSCGKLAVQFTAGRLVGKSGTLKMHTIAKCSNHTRGS